MDAQWSQVKFRIESGVIIEEGWQLGQTEPPGRIGDESAHNLSEIKEAESRQVPEIGCSTMMSGSIVIEILVWQNVNDL